MSLKSRFWSSFLAVLAAAFLLAAFSVAWGHVHVGDRSPEHYHACLLCQWVGTPASVSSDPILLAPLKAAESIALSSDPDSVQTPRYILRGRSPPSVPVS